MQVLESELLGEVASEKEISRIKHSTREARQSTVYLSFELLGRIVTFSPHIHTIVEPLREALVGSISSKVLGAVQEALKRIVAGVQRNPSVDPRNLLLFLHQVIKVGSLETAGSARESSGAAASGNHAKLGVNGGKVRLSKHERILRQRRTKMDTFMIRKVRRTSSQLGCVS